MNTIYVHYESDLVKNSEEFEQVKLSDLIIFYLLILLIHCLKAGLF